MNVVSLTGRFTADPELRKTPNDKSVVNFTIAVDRDRKVEGQPTCDFIPIVVWGQSAEFVDKYFGKGTKIEVVGSIQTRTYEDNEGKTKRVTEILASHVGFAESKKKESDPSTTESGYNDPTDEAEEFYATDDNDGNAIPF